MKYLCIYFLSVISVNTFKLYDRATHVFSEANRVLQFKKTCDAKPSDASGILGKLMNESHAVHILDYLSKIITK
jgi:N-acetylgalactosamine kinase